MRYALIAVALVVTGCAKEIDPVDAACLEKRGQLRHQYFLDCMKALPAGPVSTRYNDWDDVVDSCSSNAFYTASPQVQC